MSLKETFDLTAVLVGSKEDQSHNQTITKLVMEQHPTTDGALIDLTGKTDLRSLCSIIKDAKAAKNQENERNQFK